MTSFYNFTHKIETGWAKKFIKFILETWNVNDVIVYLWFRYLRIKKKKYAIQERVILHAQNLQ